MGLFAGPFSQGTRPALVYCSEEWKMNKKKGIVFLLLTLSLAALAGVVFFAKQVSTGLSTNQSISKFPVQIQEYMASNTLYPNPNGVCTDWVELYNASNADIDIGGFKLTEESRKAGFTVPSGTILPRHGYYVIYCLRSGGSEYADFGISRSGGEELMLLNRKNVLIDSVKTMALPDNASAQRDETGTFHICYQPSPGGAALPPVTEAEPPAEEMLRAVPGPVTISEVIPANTLYADGQGRITDMVELVNASDAAVDIGGYTLQDGVDGKQLEVPQGTVLAPGGYYLIYCARNQLEGLYADFGISRNGGELLLLYTAEGVLTDYVTTEPCGKNESTVHENGAVRVSAFITPGYANTEAGLEACLEACTAKSPVRFSEIMTANKSVAFDDQTTPDWVELYNASAADVDLSGYGFSDSAATVRYFFPQGTVLRAGAYLVLPCDGNEGKGENAVHIGLSALGGEIVYLTRPDGTLCAAAMTVACEQDTSLVYEGGVRPTISNQPTPGYPNDEAGAAAYRATQPTAVRGLVISEFMPDNSCTVASRDGLFADWVELYNESNKTLDLGQFCLSDKESDPTLFRLPARTVAPGEYVLVWCGRDVRGAAGEIWAPFGLSSKNGSVVLSSLTGEILDKAGYAASEADRSFARDASGTFQTTDCPTPGHPNTAAGYQAALADWVPQGLYISEVMPSNRTVARVDGNYYDWVELCNGTAASIRLSDYRLTDDKDEPGKYVLPDVTLKSGDTILIYCSGDASLTGKGNYHCPFKLNGGEDRLYLYGADGKLLDYLHIYKVPPQGSIGRNSRDGRIMLYDAPTPARENRGGSELKQFSVMPTADKGSGVFENAESFFVTLLAPGTIYYTMDGTRPTVNSAVYTAPLEISKTSVLRAAALEPDKRLSDVLTLAYTVNEGHTLPVANLIMAPDDLFGAKGIYSHPNETWQRDGCIVYTDANGTVTHDCGVRLSGQHSRTRQQKSFKLVFSDQYGGRLRYDVFGDTCEQGTFPQLLLRAGIDSKYGIYREPLIQKLALPYRDTTFVQDSVPCVVYVNGTYYGIYQVMESLCEETLADRLGVDTDSITLFKGFMYSNHKYLEIYQLMEYVESHDMKVPEYYEYAKAHLAFEDLIDWAIFEAYCRNADVSGNVRYFKSTETDGRWHFVFYDVECGFKVAANFNAVFGNGQTAIFLKSLLRNGEFRDMFLQRLAFHCKNTFQQDKVLSLLYWYDAAVRPEYPRHFQRWNMQPITYVYHFNKMEKLLKADRVKELQDSAKKYLKMTDEEYNRYFKG